VRRADSLDEFLADPTIAVVVVAVRHDRLAAVVAAALRARKHVVAEKPVALTARQIEELARLARDNGVHAAVLYPRRLHPCAQSARELIAGDHLGQLISFEGRFLATQVRFRQPDSWLFRREFAGGGILLWLGCHYLDLLQYVAGDPIEVVGAHTAIRSGEKIDVEDSVALTLRFRSGAVGTFHAAYALAFAGEGYVNPTGYDAYLSWNGQKGRIVWPGLDPVLRVETAEFQGERRHEVAPSSSYAGELGELFFRTFFAAIRGNGKPPTTLDDALRTARVVEAAERSVAAGTLEVVVTGDDSRA
jgi:predicted dehydrogenase